MNIIPRTKLERNEYRELALIVISIILSTIIFSYSDFKALTVNTIQVWDALFSGRIQEFFLVSAENLRNSPAGGNSYGILYLLPWAIWNFPIWITHMSEYSNVLTPMCLLWSKLFLILCSIITSYYVKKIVDKFTGDRSIGILSFILTLGAGSLLVSVGYSGQDEIIYLMLMIMGINYLLDGKRKTAFALFGYSVICCNAILIPVLAILLLYEKNILKLLSYLILFIAPDKIISFLCGSSDVEWLVNSSQYKMTANYTMSTYMDWFFGRSTLSTGVGTISLYIVVLVLIYVKCYFTKTDEKEKLSYDTLFYPTIILVGMCLLSWLHFYRYYICIPFLVCTILIKGYKKNDYAVGLLFLTIFNYLQTYVSIEDVNNFSYAYNTMNDVKAYSGHLASGSIYSVAKAFIPQIDLLSIAINSCYLAMGIIVIIYICQSRNSIGNFKIPEKMIRLTYVILPVALVLLYLVLGCKISITENTITSDSPLAEAINGENGIYQEYVAKGNKLKYIDIRSCTWNREYSDDLYLCVDLVDSETGEVVDSEKVWANNLPNNDNIRVYFNTNVDINKTYYLKFYSNKYSDDETNWIYLMKSENVENGYILTSVVVETI